MNCRRQPWIGIDIDVGTQTCVPLRLGFLESSAIIEVGVATRALAFLFFGVLDFGGNFALSVLSGSKSSPDKCVPESAASTSTSTLTPALLFSALTFLEFFRAAPVAVDAVAVAVAATAAFSCRPSPRGIVLELTMVSITRHNKLESHDSFRCVAFRCIAAL